MRNISLLLQFIANILKKGILVMSIALFSQSIYTDDYTQLQNKYEKSDAQKRSDILLRMSRIDSESQRYDAAMQNAQEAYSIALANNQKKEATHALTIIATIYWKQNKMDEALSHFLRAEIMGTGVLEKKERFYLHLSLAQVYMARNDFGNADERFLSARQLMYELNDNTFKAIYFFEHAQAYKNISKERAYSDLSDALSNFDKYEKNPLKGKILLEKAKLSHSIFGSEQALSDTEQLIDYAIKIDNIPLKIEGELFISSLFIEMGELEKALDILYTILESTQRTNNYSAAAKTYVVLGSLFDDLRYKEKAIEFFKKAIELFEKENDYFNKTTTLLLLTKLFLDNDMISDANNSALQAYNYSTEYNYNELIPFCDLYKGILITHEEKYDTAITILKKVQKSFIEKNNLEGIAETYYALSIAYEKNGKMTNALSAIDEAIIITSKLSDDSTDTVLKIVARAGSLHSQQGNHKLAVSYFEKYASMKNRQDILLQSFSERQLRFESEQNKKEILKMENKQRIKERSIIIHRFFILLGVFGMVFLSVMLIKKSAVSQKNSFNSLNSTFLKKFKLSKRESEIIHLIALGHTNKEVSSTLFIAEGTVKQHINTIFKKMHVRNRVELLNALKGYTPHVQNTKENTI